MMGFMTLSSKNWGFLKKAFEKQNAAIICDLMDRQKAIQKLSDLQKYEICFIFEAWIQKTSIGRVVSLFVEQNALKYFMDIARVSERYFHSLLIRFYPNFIKMWRAGILGDQADIWLDETIQIPKLAVDLSAYVSSSIRVDDPLGLDVFNKLIAVYKHDPKIKRRHMSWSLRRAYSLDLQFSDVGLDRDGLLASINSGSLDMRELVLINFLEGYDPSTLLCKATRTQISSLCKANPTNLALKETLHLTEANFCRSTPKKWAEHINEFQSIHVVSPMRANEKAKTLYQGIEFETLPKRIRGSKISVIMPSYNNGDLLAKAIESILNQTWKNLELIIVDDCSTDNSMQIARKYAKQDKRIKVFQNAENSGPYVSRNKGLFEASGKYFTVNDSDDISHLARLESHYDFLESYPDVMGVYSMLTRLTNAGVFVNDYLGRFRRMNASSLMVRRKVALQTVGYWDNVRFGGDSEYISRIEAIHGADSIKKLSLPLMFCNYEEHNLTKKQGNVLAGLSGERQKYRNGFVRWHKTLSADVEGLYEPVPQYPEGRPFPAVAHMCVPFPVLKNLKMQAEKKQAEKK
ncbi:MAG: hypothetical protein COA43_13430 [Robiginitomaculum sp.]|nr:MAG: hypothetical protein COA43_13430 [Robiginitomaculum sp.]